MKPAVVAAACLVFFCASARAEDKNVIRIPLVRRIPTINDFVNGTPREAEVEVSDFRQRVPGDGTPASRRTRAYLSYDRKTLYVAFVCDDEPGIATRAHRVSTPLRSWRFRVREVL